MSISTRFPHPLLLFLVICLLPSWNARAQENEPGALPAERVQERVREVEGSTRFDEATRTRLLALYQRTLENLDRTNAYRISLDEERYASRTAPLEIEALERSISRLEREPPQLDLEGIDTLSFEELEGALARELSSATELDGELAAIDSRLDTEALRPEQARKRIDGARALLNEAEDSSRSIRESGELPELAEASRWEARTRAEALRAEIDLLGQETLSQGKKFELLRLRRQEAMLALEVAAARVAAHREALNERRRGEANEASAEATRALQAPDQNPAVTRLAKDNLDLVSLLQTQADELEKASAMEREAARRTAQVADAFRSTRRKLQLGSSGAPLGRSIREQRRQLPDVRVYERVRRQLHRSIAAASARLSESGDDRGGREDTEAYVDARIAAADSTVDESARAELVPLATSRQKLLERALTNDRRLVQQLHGLDEILKHLEERTAAFDEFLAERLLWVRSSRAVGLASLATLPRQVAAFVSPQEWVATGSAAFAGLARTPFLWLAVLLAARFLVRRKRLRAVVVRSASPVGRVERDTIWSTVLALLCSLMLAAPFPLLLATLGQSLRMSPRASAFSSGVASGLIAASALLALLLLVRALLASGGVLEGHFGWSPASLAVLRRQLGWFTVAAVPSCFVAVSAGEIDLGTSTGILSVVGMATLMLALVWLGSRVFHPKQSLLRAAEGVQHSTYSRWRYPTFLLAVAIPATLTVLALVGFQATSWELARRLFHSAWLLLVLALANALARRWLLITRRRLAKKARERASASAQDSDAGEPGVAGTNELGAPRADIGALDADSRMLLSALTVLLAAVGLATIWGQMIPALRVFEGVELWNRTLVDDGVERLVPITLEDVLMTALIGIGAFILARNLPSLLDIVLLKGGRVSAGGRYAVSTLARYSIIAVAIVMMLGSLGFSWSQLGWLAAALSVGIGFGLQEIVANFICGLILLFEQPIRVGDVVTLGDAGGRVVRIRIRATTIRDWEQRELVVPNKELITGRVLNWSLTDATTRVLINVGIAYGSDVKLAMSLVQEAARECETVLEDPAPIVTFEQFGDSSLNLSLRAFVGSIADRLQTITALHNSIDQKFRDANIVIAFPQIDVHLDREQQSP